MIPVLVVWLVPFVASFALRGLRRAHAARLLGAGVLAIATGVAAWLTVAPPIASPWFGVDGLSAILVLTQVSLALAVLVASPRVELDARAVADLLLLTGLNTGTLVARSLSVFMIFWAGAMLPLWLEARRSNQPALRRSFWVLVFTSAVPMIAALVLLQAGVRSPLVAPLALIGAAARAGVFPLHIWLPPVVENARMPIAVPFAIAPLGTFAAGRVVLELFPREVHALSGPILACATASAIYGALLTLGRHNVKRQIAFVWISVVGFVFVGIGSIDAGALSGALLYDLAGAIAVTGLLVIAGGVEARTGTSDMRRLGGLVRSMPHFATGFLLLGLAVVCFPGTAGFISEDLLIQGLHEAHPGIATALLVATAANGISLVRSYKRVFLGPKAPHADEHGAIEDMLPRERWVSVLLVIALIAGGFAPAPLLGVRAGVVASLKHLS